LDDLCAFAAKHPNLLLEFKTKSDRVDYFLSHSIPRNVVCSWSLNPQTVIANEEHFTASLDKRLKAARLAADKGVKVAFHFHPIFYYEGWEADYSEIVSRLLSEFDPSEVLFISFGTVTFIKPVIRQIRKRGDATKMLQMKLEPAMKNKWSYPESLKVEQFKTVFQAFQPWHEKVFFYLCMEPSGIWDQVFGWHYSTNELFEQDFGRKTMAKTV
jgi:spore photoproduct lyase